MTGHSCHKEGETQTSDCRDQYSCCWAGFRGCIVEVDFLMIIDSDGGCSEVVPHVGLSSAG